MIEPIDAIITLLTLNCIILARISYVLGKIAIEINKGE